MHPDLWDAYLAAVSLNMNPSAFPGKYWQAELALPLLLAVYPDLDPLLPDIPPLSWEKETATEGPGFYLLQDLAYQLDQGCSSLYVSNRRPVGVEGDILYLGQSHRFWAKVMAELKVLERECVRPLSAAGDSLVNGGS